VPLATSRRLVPAVLVLTSRMIYTTQPTSRRPIAAIYRRTRCFSVVLGKSADLSGYAHVAITSADKLRCAPSASSRSMCKKFLRFWLPSSFHPRFFVGFTKIWVQVFMSAFKIFTTSKLSASHLMLHGMSLNEMKIKKIISPTDYFFVRQQVEVQEFL